MNSIVKKIENWATTMLVAFLCLYPFVMMFFQNLLKIQIKNADTSFLQFMFVFSCLAGIITWREDEHLKLSSLAYKLGKKAEKIADTIKNFIIASVVTTLFLNAFCQFLNTSLFTESTLGIPNQFFFFFLPLCYLSFAIMHGLQKNFLIATIAGIVTGFFISTGSLSGVFYYLFNIEYIPLLQSISDIWNSFAAAAIFPLCIIMVISAFFGVPLFIVLAGICHILFSSSGGYVDVIPLEVQRIFTDKSVAAIPLFTIGGYILAQSSAGERYVSVFKALFGWFRGGIVVAAVVVTTFFSTFTGVSGVTILALGVLLSTVLTGNGYNKDKAESLITASGAIGLLFPPSAAIIMFSTVNYFSVDVFDMFKGAIIPGILMAAAMIVMGIIFDKQTERPKFNFHEVLNSISKCIPELLLPGFICFFFFRGIFDLFEVSAFTLIYALVVTTFIRKDFSFKFSLGTMKGDGNEIFTKDEENQNPAATESSDAKTLRPAVSKRTIFEVISSSIPISGGVLFILSSASGVAYYILDAAVPQILSSFMISHISHPWAFLLLMNVVLLAVGCLMDVFSAILIVSPLFIETGLAYGLNPVSIGVIFLLNLSIGFITPPVGMDLFISKYAFNKPLGKVIRGIIPFIVVQLGVLLMVTYIPWFTTALINK